jgi:hypothetical protein
MRGAATQIFTSWNQMVTWLRQLQGHRVAAFQTFLSGRFLNVR